jgi:adenylate cyclase
VMSEENVDARPLTSVELLDAAVWREVDSDEAQPQAAFLEALSHLVGRWLMVRSDAPGMDVVTVLCKARGYIARQEVRQTTNDEIEWRR